MASSTTSSWHYYSSSIGKVKKAMVNVEESQSEERQIEKLSQLQEKDLIDQQDSSIKNLLFRSNSVEDTKRLREFSDVENFVLSCNWDSLPSDLLSGFGRLRNLRIRDNSNLRGIQPGCFQNVGTVRKLAINHAVSAEFKPGILRGLSALEELNLSENNLSNLEKEFLADVSTSLKRLNLSKNKIKCVKEDVFKVTPHLLSLNLSNNEIEKVDENMFSSLKGLSYLDMSNNKLKEIKPKVFRQLPSLTALILDGNGLEKIDSDIFDGLENLEYLSLHNNKLSDVKAESFSKMKSLKVLLLNGNHTSSLTEESIRKVLPNLVTLRL